jgi:uracil-DNA glycosylase family 4
MDRKVGRLAPTFSAEVRAGEVHPDCAACPFAKSGRPLHFPVRPTLPTNPIKGVVIGESPGRIEAEEHAPFVGYTGEAFTEELGKADVDRADLLMTYAIGCTPPDGLKTTTNMLAAAKACRPWIRSIIKPHIPKKTPTLTMGKWASFLVGKKALAVTNRRGFINYKHPRYSPWIMTWHPTFAIFHDPFRLGEFRVDVDRWARSMRGELVRPKVKLIIKPTLQDVQALWDEPFITCDIETGAAGRFKPWTGKDPTQATLKVLGLGTSKVGLAIWWEDASWPIKKEVEALLADKSILKVMQNGWWFDMRVLSRYGIKVNNMADTRDMRRAISVTSRLSLGYMGSLYLDIEDWKLKGGDDEK